MYAAAFNRPFVLQEAPLPTETTPGAFLHSAVSAFIVAAFSTVVLLPQVNTPAEFMPSCAVPVVDSANISVEVVP